MRSDAPYSGLIERIEQLTGRRRDVIGAAVAFVILVLIALALMARGAPAEIAPPATDPAASLPAAVEIVASPSASVIVHVAGAVVDPGVYSLPIGARVTDAIEAAGGPRRHADLDSLNLAALLTDGEKVEVTRAGSGPGGGVASVTTVPSAAPGAPISINSADEPALETIPGVGPVTAAAILKYRDEIGRFDSIDQLLDVPGIGPATLDSIRPYVAL